MVSQQEAEKAYVQQQHEAESELSVGQGFKLTASAACYSRKPASPYKVSKICHQWERDTQIPEPLETFLIKPLFSLFI